MIRKLTTAMAITAFSALSLNAFGYTPLSFRISPIQNQAASLQSAAPLAQKAEAFKNWGLWNSSKDGKALVPSHIHAPEAWKLEEGNRTVVVAVIDTGIDAGHPDLKENLWSDPKEKSVYGWNFITNSANPGDEHGHGTHVAGIIGAVTNPIAGISGVAKHVSIMPVKYYSDAAPPSLNVKNSALAIEWAVNHGAQIINYSGGGPEFSEEEYLAIKKAEAAGVLIVAAAGNERQDIDMVSNYYYPASYGLSNIISVAGIDIDNNLFKSSNWGKRKVDVAAPGEKIYSTFPINKGKYGYMTGTSQATPFVAGLAALLLSKNPKLTPAQIKTIIRSTVDQIPNLNSKIGSGGKINAYTALLALINGSSPVFAKGPDLVLNQKSFNLSDTLSLAQ